MPDDERAIHRFNRTCAWIAALWLFIAIPITLIIRPTYQDFSLYYVAGVCSRTGNWDALYPRIPPNAPELDIDASLIKPRLLELAAERKVPIWMPYIQPAWNAIIFVPLSLLPFPVASWIWTYLLAASMFGIVLYAGRTYTRCAGRASRTAGIMMLVLAFSLLTYRTMRIRNVSQIVGLAIAFATFELARHDGIRSAVAIWLGGLLKFATIALLPILVLTRRYRAILWTVVFGIATIAVAYLIAGRATMAEYAIVASEIGKSMSVSWNQSLHGFLLRATHRSPLSEPILWLMRAVQLTTLIALLAMIVRQRKNLLNRPPILFASVVGLTAWLLIFSPLFWDHYHIYFAPFWGWLVWEATQSLLKRIAVIVAIGLAWAPVTSALWFHWPEPFGSYLLWSACIMFALAMTRLVSTKTTLPLEA
ncbi:MAG TPA: glycosyltransferase 87 family protein [Tepidisphaeraceae bacterium]|nr:glycosyltransferase 87 family protein [Tepidisphaeraceae bacterium]